MTPVGFDTSDKFENHCAGALSHLYCSIHTWTDSQVVLNWITNPNLHLSRFIKRRVDKILGIAPSNCWRYVHTSVNPADIGTRDGITKNLHSLGLLFSQGYHIFNMQKENRIFEGHQSADAQFSAKN